MSRYIDYDALDYKNWNMIGKSSDFIDGVVYIAERIEEAPSIDIVFCKECKHRPIKEDPDGEDYGFNIIKPNGLERCPCLVADGWYSWMPEDDFYCGYGERREP